MDQKTALKIMKSGKSVFLTGPAGAGKTYVLNEFIQWAKRKKKSLARTATTGLAATHIGGCTIHSWTGIGINREIPYNFFEKLPKTRRQRICEADILIIDEVSMMHDYMLNMVSEICKIVRESNRPFGGLQVILAGDFAQLPPINREEDEIQGWFAYGAAAWEELDPAICYLSTQYRQEDLLFLEILNAIREGTYRRHHIEALLERVGAELETDTYTELYTTNFNVDRVNDRRMDEIYDEYEETYEMTWKGSTWNIEKLKKSVLAPEFLRLKVGATVMALKNNPSEGYVNGSIGEVIDFEYGNPVVHFNNGKIVTVERDTWDMFDGDHKIASVKQIPLKPAWAMTVHKAQGMTLDSAKLDLRRVFEVGMGYVALSRVKSLDSMSLIGIGKRALLVSKEAMGMNRKWEGEAERLSEEFAKKFSREKSQEPKGPKEPKEFDEVTLAMGRKLEAASKKLVEESLRRKGLIALN